MTTMKCHACGVAKNAAAKEPYPFPGDGVIDDEPIVPFLAIECRGLDWRIAIVCHRCLHALQPDLWISETQWASITPITPFSGLPFPSEDQATRFEVDRYDSYGSG